MPFRRRRSVEIPPLAAPEEAPPAPGEGEMESSPSPLPGARGRRRRWSPISLVDRYLASEILMVTAFCILGFAILIVGNNFYNAHDLIFKKGLDIPITMLAWLAVLDAPASMVLSLPIATTFGVMLAVGRMGRDSELIAMRAGGASLGRILRPILFVGLLLSIFNYYAGEFWVPQVGNQAATLRRQHLSRESEHRHRDQFFRDNEGRIIYTAQYDDRTKVLEQPFVMQIDEQGPGVEDDLLHFWRSGSQGKFEEDELVLTEMGSVKHHVCAWNPALEGWELWYKEELTAPEQVRLPFPAELQAIAAEQENARYLSARDLYKTISRFKVQGRDPLRIRTDLAVKYATPVACAVFAFVAFIFGVVNPRREKFTGVFFALVMIFWYYVLNAIAKNLGYNGVIRPPELAAWLTNIGFLLLATLLFLRMR